MEGVSIIIPTLNEAENIDPLIERIHTALQPYDFSFEIVFSDGASTDTTRELIQNWQQKANVQLVENTAGKGLAAAVIAGAREATYDFVVVMDADLSHPPEVIPDLVEPLMKDTADMVVGSRYVRGGETPDWPLRRKTISFLATLPARLFTHIKDPLAGFIAVRQDRLAKIEDEVCGFKIGLELLATGEDTMRVQEVPITFRDRRWGESKLSTTVVRDYLKQLLLLVGINFLPGGFSWLFPVFLAFMVIDCAFFTAFVHYGIAAGWAHWFSFALAAGISGFIAVKRIPKEEIRNAGGLLNWYFIGIICIFILTLFLRSGFVATLLRMQGEFSTAAVFYLGIVGFLLAYVGIILWVHSRHGRRIGGRQLSTYYGLGVVFYLVMLRFAYLGGLDLLPEEQYYYDLLTRIYNGEAAKALPVPAVVGAIGLPNFPESILGFRVGVGGLWFVSLIFIFSLARDMYDRQIAFVLVLLFSIVPFFFAAGFFVTSEAVLSLIWCAALFFLYRAVVAEGKIAWIWAGIILGVGIQLDMRLIALLVGMLFYLLCSTANQKLMSRSEPYVCAAVILLTFLPAIMLRGGIPAFNVENVEVYSGPLWIESIAGGMFTSFWGLLIILLTPTVLAGGVVWGWLVIQARRTKHCRDAEREERQRLFLIAVFGVPFIIFLIPGLFEKNIVCAAGLVWAGLMPPIAALLFLRGEGRYFVLPGKVSDGGAHGGEIIGAVSVQKRTVALLQWCWWPTVGVMVLIYGLVLHLLVV